MMRRHCRHGIAQAATAGTRETPASASRGSLPGVILVGVLLDVFVATALPAATVKGDTLLFLGNLNIAPVIFLKDSQPTGVAIDLVRELARHIPEPLDIDAMDWSEAQAIVARGEADALIQINATEERMAQYDFSEPLLESQFSIFTATNKVGISGLSSLRGLRVGVEAGGLPRLTLEKNPLILLTIIPNFLDGFKMINKGSLDAVVVDYRVGSYLLAENNLHGIKVSGEPIAFSYSSIAVRKGNAALLGAINRALRIIKADGSYQAVLDRWEPTEVVFRTRGQLVQERYKVMVALTLFLLLIALAWSATLMRQLAKKRTAQETLRKQHSTLSGIIESTDAIIFSVDRRHCYTSFNKRHASTMKAIYDADIAIGASLLDSMAKVEDREHARRNLERALAGERFVEEAYSGEALRVRRCFRVAHSPISTDQGEVIGVAVISQDITDRKQAEEALREGQHVFRVLVEDSPDIIARYDRECRRTYVNPVYLKVAGIDKEQLLATSPVQLSPLTADGAAALQELLRTVLETGSAKAIDVRWPQSDSGERWYNTNAYPERDREGRVVSVMTISRDITERQRAEQEKEKLQDQLLQSQKMESVGRLAGGVAHDFNNMLSVILGYTSMGLEEVDSSNPLHASLEQVRSAALRSADLTQQLLTFARKQTVAPRVLDLNETIADMLKMLRRLIGEDIDLKWCPSEDLWPIKVDPSQIDQILANLCVNARDAIANVGRITIETANSVYDAEYCASHADVAEGEYVRLAVSDNGCGMSREMMAHIFEPFFTSKEVGKGTGLGLAMVYGSVRQNGGFINVYSELGIGTTFAIYLPRHVGPGRLPKRKEGAAALAVGGHETILLVEDEPAILQLTAIQLQRQGYTVLVANTPGEAIRLAGEYAGEIHLLMTDVVMPEMNGRDLARNLLARYPGLHRLFMSGYTANVIAHHGVLDEGVHFIQKPFTLEVLAASIRSALDGE